MDPMIIGLIVDTLGAFVMMGLALWVWRVRPHHALNRRFAALVSVLAVSILFLNIGWSFDHLDRSSARDLFGALGGAILLVASVLVVRLERCVPRTRTERPSRADRALPPLLACLYLATIVLSLVLTIGSVNRTVGPTSTVAALLNGVGVHMLTAAVVFLVVRMAFRYARSGPAEGHLRWQTATIAIALGGFPFYAAATGAIEVPVPGAVSTPFDGLLLFPLVTVAVVWLWAGAGPHGRLATATALVLLTLVLAGMAIAARYGSMVAINSGILGGVRVLGTLLLAYAIVRHQLFDIDLKIKWTISRGTLVGIFLAVFFVGTVMAENFLTDRYGWAVGGVSAGLLLFALTPLQRLADQVSTFAMPHVHDSADYRSLRMRSIYQAAVTSALRDGHVSDEERDLLATLADELGLSAGEARSLEREMTDDAPTA